MSCAETERITRVRGVDMLLLFGLGLLCRLIAVAVVHPIPIEDARVYDDLARLMVSGQRFFSTYRTPGYLMFLALCHWLLGPTPVSAQIVQALIGSFGVVAVYLLAHRLANRPVAFTAGMLASTHIGLVAFVTVLMTETLFVALFALLLLFLASGWHRSPVGSILCGVLFGVTSLVRPSLVYFIVPIVTILFVGQKWRHGLLLATAFVVSVELTFLPQQVYQFLQWRHLVVLDLNSGLNFYIGNRPDASGRYNLSTDWKEHAPFVGKNGYERDRIAFAEGLRFVTANPRRFCALTFGKATEFWTLPLYGPDLRLPRWVGLLDQLQWFLLVILGVVGTLVTLRLPPFWLLHLCIVYFWSVHALTFNDYRYRLQILPALFVLAAMGAVSSSATLASYIRRSASDDRINHRSV